MKLTHTTGHEDRLLGKLEDSGLDYADEIVAIVERLDTKLSEANSRINDLEADALEDAQ